MTYEDGLTLVRSGQFRSLLDRFVPSSDAPDVSPQLRTLVAYVSALTDDVNGAVPLLQVNDAKLSAATRSQIETTHGITAGVRGRMNWRGITFREVCD